MFPYAMLMKHILAIAVLALCVGGCKWPQQAKDLSDFSAFYERFHNDSLYQMEHILFPIDGFPSAMDTSLASIPDFRWTEDLWRMHRPFKFEGSGFKQELNVFGDDVVTEQVIHETGSFAMMRRFARIDGEWYLIYFADMNPVKKQDSGITIDGGF